MIDRHHAEHYRWGEQCDGWHLVQQPTLSVIHERMPPGTSEVRHHHERARQFFFVLSGVATFELDGRVERLGTQQGVEVPPGVAHRIRNDTAEPIEFLVISQPPTRGDRIVESDAPDDPGGV